VHSFAAFGEIGRLYDETDWLSTPVGDPEQWSDTLRGVVDRMLQTQFVVTLLWGPELVLLYNAAYAGLIGDKHPAALGARAREVFPEAWGQIGPMLESVMTTGQSTYVVDTLLPLERHGFLEECYFTFSYSPVRNLDGEVEGILDITTETTDQVLARRRLWLLTRLNEVLAGVARPQEVADAALEVLRQERADLPEVDIVPAGEAPMTSGSPDRGGIVTFALDDDGVGPDTLVVRLSSMLLPDEIYLGFVGLVAAALRQAFDRARARDAERREAEVQRNLAEMFQRSLLPIPAAGGRPDVAVRYRPAAEQAQIGGDWYDLFRVPDGSLMVVVGDVAGHDQQSAAAMAQVRNMTRGVAYTLDAAMPGPILRGIDRAMAGSAADVVATGVVARVSGAADDGGLRFTWSNAGHLPPVLIDVDGAATLLERPADLLLGLDVDARRDDHEIDLPPGATMLLYTDGLVERRGVPIADGLAWLVQMLSGQHGRSPDELCDYLLEHASVTEDDVALLVLRA
jgi:serine phosphatase RsbU (regulator of sigma subunit)